jgi:hypothetical protein
MRFKDVRSWLVRQVQQGMPLLMMEAPGLPLIVRCEHAGRAQRGERTGLSAEKGRAGGRHGVRDQPGLPAHDYTGWLLTPQMQQQSRQLLSFDDAKGRASSLPPSRPGAVLMTPYVVTDVPGTEQSRWVIDPFALLKQALRPEDFPSPM